MIIKVGNIDFMEVADSFPFEEVRDLAFGLIFDSCTYPLQKDEQIWQLWGYIQALRGGCTLEGTLGRLGAGVYTSFLRLALCRKLGYDNRPWLPPCTGLPN